MRSPIKQFQVSTILTSKNTEREMKKLPFSANIGVSRPLLAVRERCLRPAFLAIQPKLVISPFTPYEFPFGNLPFFPNRSLSRGSILINGLVIVRLL